MANKQLILLRHAKSDWSSHARTDFERPLNERGRRDAPRMGRWLADNGYTPESLVASPSARTTETIELVCAALSAQSGDEAGGASNRVCYDRRLYHGGAEQIQAVAAEQLARFDIVLIVAHNPGMEMALLDYCPAAESFADGKIMPTCAVAVVEFDRGGDGVGEKLRAGKLCARMRPSEL